MKIQLRRLAMLAPVAAWVGLMALLPATAQAQSRPLRIIVPYAAGGPIDVTARVLAERVRDALGPVIIENKPGGGGTIGADLVAKAAPDGLTLGIAALATPRCSTTRRRACGWWVIHRGSASRWNRLPAAGAPNQGQRSSQRGSGSSVARSGTTAPPAVRNSSGSTSSGPRKALPYQ